jgi:exopolysaccharide production protein ExoQ
VIVEGSSTKGTRASGRVPKERADASNPSTAEWWFVYVVLLATAVIPGLAIHYSLLNQTVIQIFWSIAYVIAGRQLLNVRAQVLPIMKRCAPLWAILVLMFASALWSVNPYTTIIDSIELFGTTIIGLYIATRFTLTDFLRIVAIMFATVGCVCLVLVFFNPGYGRADWGAGPWQGIYQDKNLLGAGASLAIISQVALLPSTKGRGRWLLSAGILLSGILLIGANSMTAFGNCSVVVVAALVAFACRSPRFGGFARFATVLGAVIAITSIYVFSLTPDSVFSVLGRQSNLTGRADFWPYLQQAVADRPVLGFGFDAFFLSSIGTDYLAEYVVQAGGWSPYHAHNSYLQTELDAGYVGLAMLIILLGISSWKAIVYFTRERSSTGIWPLAVILFLTAGSFTETYYLNYNTLEWILLVAAIVYPLQSSVVRARVRIAANNVAPAINRVGARGGKDRL